MRPVRELLLEPLELALGGEEHIARGGSNGARNSRFAR